MTVGLDSMSRLLGMIDLTSLNEDDTPARIEALCQLADTPFGAPAAVCVYPEYVVLARRTLDGLGLAGVPVAGVANFPDGGADPDRVLRECRRLRSAGAGEVDVVLPYRALQAGDLDAYQRVAEASRRATGDGILKCILESGLLTDEQLQVAGSLALAAGADFIKTSTGKAHAHASLAAAERMLGCVRDCGRVAGFKASGGIRTVEDAMAYLELAERVLGQPTLDARRFRIGASALFENVLAALNGAEQSPGPGGNY